jgi:hypothetical protein
LITSYVGPRRAPEAADEVLKLLRVAGTLISDTLIGCSASSAALMMVGGTPIVPSSPIPLTRSGFVVAGTSSRAERIGGNECGDRHCKESNRDHSPNGEDGKA